MVIIFARAHGMRVHWNESCWHDYAIPGSDIPETVLQILQ